MTCNEMFGKARAVASRNYIHVDGIAVVEIELAGSEKPGWYQGFRCPSAAPARRARLEPVRARRLRRRGQDDRAPHRNGSIFGDPGRADFLGAGFGQAGQRTATGPWSRPSLWRNPADLTESARVSKVSAGLAQVPAGTLAIDGVLHLGNEVQSIDRPVEELVDVGALVRAGEEVVQSPEVDVAVFIAAEALVAVVVAAHRSELLVAVEQGRDGRLDRGGQVLVEPAAPHELGKLALGERVLSKGLHLAQVLAWVVRTQ